MRRLRRRATAPPHLLPRARSICHHRHHRHLPRRISAHTAAAQRSSRVPWCVILARREGCSALYIGTCAILDAATVPPQRRTSKPTRWLAQQLLLSHRLCSRLDAAELIGIAGPAELWLRSRLRFHLSRSTCLSWIIKYMTFRRRLLADCYVRSCIDSNLESI